MRVAVDRQERSGWGLDRYEPAAAKPARDSEEYLRGAREGAQRSEEFRNTSREASQAREDALREQRSDTSEASETFEARRARVAGPDRGAESEPPAPDAVAGASTAAAPPLEAPSGREPESGPSSGAPDSTNNSKAEVPMNQLFTTRAQSAGETASAAISKYGAVMNKQATGAPLRATGPGAQTPMIVEAASVAQRSEASAGRPIARTAPSLPTPNAERLAQAREILEQVKVKILPGMQSATISLAPAHLGRIGIKLEMRERELVAVIRADRPEALRAIEEHLPELKEMLERAGITAGEFDLGLGFEGESEQDEPKPALRAREVTQALRQEAGAKYTYTDPMTLAMARGGIDLIA